MCGGSCSNTQHSYLTGGEGRGGRSRVFKRGAVAHVQNTQDTYLGRGVEGVGGGIRSRGGGRLRGQRG